VNLSCAVTVIVVEAHTPEHPAMDVVKAVETYVTKLVSSPSAMKVLLLDSHTVCHLLTFASSKDVYAVALDTYRFSGFDAVNATFSSSLPN
jgi:hypothetical protein